MWNWILILGGSTRELVAALIEVTLFFFCEARILFLNKPIIYTVVL